ncbi:hypothetical protein BGW80DRAFT_1277508 [Lactifluus volemus]|nr:hypothetical protein BGW80DRAFT_1277508 [Lactifluus volemus]
MGTHRPYSATSQVGPHPSGLDRPSRHLILELSPNLSRIGHFEYGMSCCSVRCTGRPTASRSLMNGVNAFSLSLPE